MMFCQKCGTELLEDSRFCVKCGAKVEVENEIVKEGTENKINCSNSVKKNIDLICKNRTTSIGIILVLIVTALIGYNLIKSNIPHIENRKELVAIVEELIELKENSIYLGSAYSEKQRLKTYRTELYKYYSFAFMGLVFLIISIILIVYVGTKLTKHRTIKGD